MKGIRDINWTLNQSEQQLTNMLANKIRQAIMQNNGNISVQQYIDMALYDREYGYYNNTLAKFGHAGDFITAPLVSKLFAQCLCVQIGEFWQYSHERNILEIGSGNGQLMLDLLSLCGNQINNYYALETSAHLRQLQEQKINLDFPHLAHKIHWLVELPLIFDGIIIANELLDAQPCEVVVWEEQHIYSRCVSIDANNNFVYSNSSVNNQELLVIAQQLNIHGNYISEINLSNRALIGNLAKMLTAGMILFIDYGYTQHEYYAPQRTNGTLRGFYQQQQLDDILIYPGLIDITSSVDFTAMATAAVSYQLDCIGYVNQANFLFNCGVLDIMEQSYKQLSQLEYLKLTQQMNYLTGLENMGELFKVIGFTKAIDFSDWIGFRHNDRIHTL